MKSTRSPFGPLIAWALPQLAALILVANQIPWLPAKAMPRPAEVAALRVMLVVQFTSAALLLPLIFRDLTTTIFVLLLAGPMTLLSSFLSGEGAKWKMVYAVGCVELWLITLACWTTVFRSRRALAVASVVALALLFGGPITSFVRNEYGAGGEPLHTMSPLLDAMHASKEGNLTHGEIFRLGGLAGLSITVAVIVLTSHRRLKQATDTSPPIPTI